MGVSDAGKIFETSVCSAKGAPGPRFVDPISLKFCEREFDLELDDYLLQARDRYLDGRHLHKPMLTELARAGQLLAVGDQSGQIRILQVLSTNGLPSEVLQQPIDVPPRAALRLAVSEVSPVIWRGIDRFGLRAHVAWSEGQWFRIPSRSATPRC